MIWSWFGNWMSAASIPVIGVSVFILMGIATVVGSWLRRLHDKMRGEQPGARKDRAEGPTVTAVLTLLALLLGFSFDLAMQRFEQRREFVVQEANAIDVAYLRAQLLPQPHRKRIGDLLLAYTNNRIALAKIGAKREPALLVRNDELITDLWAATSAALGSIRQPDFSNAFLTSMNALTDLDATRKNARLIHIPDEIFAVLFIYMVVTSGLLGYLLTGMQGKMTSALVLALMALFLLLIIDIDRPMQGAIRESQAPMELLRAKFASEPPGVFDRYKSTASPGRTALPDLSGSHW